MHCSYDVAHPTSPSKKPAQASGTCCSVHSQASVFTAPTLRPSRSVHFSVDVPKAPLRCYTALYCSSHVQRSPRTSTWDIAKRRKLTIPFHHLLHSIEISTLQQAPFSCPFRTISQHTTVPSADYRHSMVTKPVIRL